MNTDVSARRGMARHVLWPALAGGLFAHGHALAQSTASQTVESVVATAHRQVSTGGLAAGRELLH